MSSFICDVAMLGSAINGNSMTTQYNRLPLGRCRARPHFVELLCGALIGSLASACNKAPSAQQGPATSTPAPANVSSLARQPLNITVSPAILPVRGGHAGLARYSIAYTINDPEKLTKAAIIFYSPGIGEVQRFPISVQASGAVDLILDPTAIDFGPKVRFRVHCPSGDSDWYTLGSPPRPFDSGNSKHEISSVLPRYVSNDVPVDTANMANAGTLITIWAGDMVTQGCTIETDVDGRSVELLNVTPMYRQMQGLLMRRDVAYRAIAARYLEVKLSVDGAKGGAIVIRHVDFDE